jgi:chromosomal replication initiation ATPase DnaA
VAQLATQCESLHQARCALGDLADTPLGQWALRHHPGRIARIVAEAYRVPERVLLSAERGSRHIAGARQAVYYLCSTAFNLPADAVARLMGRHRSTVEYGLALVEDRRDDPEFDALMDRMTEAVQAR